MLFNLNETAGLSQSTIRPVLEGNKIHEVIFDGCFSRDFTGQRDSSQTFHVLEIKFHNEDGEFTHTIWEPQETDMQDTAGVYGPQPSNVKKIMFLCKHLIDAVNPELGKQIDNKEKSISVASWDALRKFMIDATNPGKGTTTKIKLIKKNSGEAIFSPYFLNYDRDGKLYMSNFIGKNIFFTNKELAKIKKAETAKPTVTTNMDIFDMPMTQAPQTESENFDLTF